MDIVEATRGFEAWLRKHTKIVEADLRYKHVQMRADPFLFFRATFYRWAQLWPKHCPELARAPKVLAVGDLHIENFGTWRDAEGRLAWGVNDFDEAYPMAFTNDLVRLAVSTLLAASASPNFQLKPAEICAELIEGYCDAVDHAGEPFTLMEQHPKLRRMALQGLRQPAEFWRRLELKTRPMRGEPPDSACRAFHKSFPEKADFEYRMVRKPKGLGSLGRRRYLAFMMWQGGLVAREAKAVLPSACVWVHGEKCRADAGNPWLMKTVRSAVRCADPFYEIKSGWLVRRLGPDCSRIDIEELAHHEDIASLLFCMGWETANIHLGSPKARKRIRAAWKHLPRHWLEEAAHKMLKLSLADWRKFRR
jgi:hypothetical protein